MKKILSNLTVFAVIITMVFALSTEVAAAGGNLGGPSTVEKGKTFTVSYTINATGCQGINANFSYDSSVLKLNSVKDDTGATVENANGSVFLERMSNPITGSRKILNFSFTALGAKNTKTTFRLTEISLTENYEEVIMPDASYSVTISESTTSTPATNTTSNNTQSPANNPVKPNTNTSNSVSTVQAATSVTSTGSSNTATTSSDTSVVSDTVSSDTSIVSEITSSTDDTVSDTKDTASQEDTAKNGNKKIWIIIVVCVIVLFGAIGVLVYNRKKNN